MRHRVIFYVRGWLKSNEQGDGEGSQRQIAYSAGISWRCFVICNFSHPSFSEELFLSFSPDVQINKRKQILCEHWNAELNRTSRKQHNLRHDVNDQKNFLFFFPTLPPRSVFTKNWWFFSICVAEFFLSNFFFAELFLSFVCLRRGPLISFSAPLLPKNRAMNFTTFSSFVSSFEFVYFLFAETRTRHVINNCL